jgi:uncharacterized Zn finger protein (UPF0148 family)
MKNSDTANHRSCPLCGAQYGGVPSVSRLDNETLICPDCGTREALESIGVSAEEQEKILSIIHSAKSNNLHNSD